jgi:single-stranded-DNA-specific exonuclease
MSSPSFTGATWIPVDADPEAIARLCDSGLSQTAARCAAIRWGDGKDAGTWRKPSFEHLEDPFEMAGMQGAVERLRRANAEGERVRIITDYDVDGTTSSLILQGTLGLLDGDARLDYHIPHRLKDGYGFSVASADAAADDGIDLVVTADIGVRDHAAVTRAVERGVEVLICDHHLPAGSAVPDNALVLCPPQQGCTYPNPHLAACGITLKLAQALLTDHPRRDAVVRSLLKLAAVGTVADMVPLTTLENRAIVALGLAELNRGPHHAGLQALLEACQLRGGEIGETDLGFRLGPRINAAGRMADASLVVQLLRCRDRGPARELAQRVERHNQERRRVQERLVAQALKRLDGEIDPFVVVAGPEEEGWHRGVVGIVASRIKDEVHRPVAVVSIKDEWSVGSVRSIPSVHAVQALETASDLLVKFGGHPAAAGFTVPTADLDALRERLCAYVVAQGASLERVRRVDAEIPATALDMGLHDELASLGPFGMGNPRPRLMVRGVQVRQVKLLGSAQRMVRFRLPRPGRGDLEAVWWDRADLADTLSTQPIDLLGALGLNRWNGGRRLQFRVTDARPTR